MTLNRREFVQFAVDVRAAYQVRGNFVKLQPAIERPADPQSTRHIDPEDLTLPLRADADGDDRRLARDERRDACTTRPARRPAARAPERTTERCAMAASLV